MFKSLFFILIACFSQVFLFADTPASEQMQQTLTIIKPDAVSSNHIGDIIARFEKNGLKVVAIKMLSLDSKKAGDFYAEHKERPFYGELVSFMSSGPIVVMVLEGEDAVAKNRQIIGSTDPKKADKGTIRADFAESKGKNAVHGSDSVLSAKREISFFFETGEISKH